MIAILGGLGAALAFAAATVCSARSSRLIGVGPALAFVMLVGLVVTLPIVAAAGLPAELDRGSLGWLAVGGIGNVLGLGLEYAGLRVGKVGVVAPIASTEGAIAAVIAVVLGERIAPGVGATLAVIAAGIVLAGAAGDEGEETARSRNGQAVLFSVGAAVAFGASLYATGRVSEELPVAWVVLPARVVGVLAVALPLALVSRLRLTRRAAPLVVIAGCCEVAGFAAFALGARHGIAVSAVLSSQFAALAALAAFVLFRERLVRLQLAGVAAIVVGVAVLSGLQA